MSVIKVIYDDGSNGLVKIKKNKRSAQMISQEIVSTCFGLFR